MNRRAVVGAILLAVVAGGAGVASAGEPKGKPHHELCVITSSDPDHSSTQDFCITWPGPVLTQ
jgi:hypothetical protein